MTKNVIIFTFFCILRIFEVEDNIYSKCTLSMGLAITIFHVTFSI